ncbi:hypothetical protein IF1G_10824 [Cordyceps javanica]|uniref:Uncharacterized protein n=1 Tax=Cordyceps javanica TaxID=43265 RepID=A0A545VJH7_9HYPO|nr:hypothetical protein IF1G_10824 [Cordyceps javanica]TQW01879.1 ser-Thr-rich glycosyl-phosphatidyl-inositol-anchored membrane family domain-containing protein [Cordyceps javanica]
MAAPPEWRRLDLLLLFLFASSVHGQTSTTKGNITFRGIFGEVQGFLYANPVYNVGDPIEVHWNTVYEAVDIWLGQKYPDTPSAAPRLQAGISNGSFTWHPSLDDFPASSGTGRDAVLFFRAYEGGSLGSPTQSHSFNLTLPDNLRSTSSAQPSPTLSLDLSNGKPKPATGLSGPAVAGIAVGAALAAALFAIGLGLVLWRRCRSRREHAVYGNKKREATIGFEPGHSTASDEFDKGNATRYEVPGDVPPIELDCDSEIRPELDATTTMKFPPPPERPEHRQTRNSATRIFPWSRWIRGMR